MNFLFVLLFLARILGSRNNSILDEEPMENEFCSIRSEYFELLYEYFESIFTVTVVDLLPEDSMFRCTSDTFLREAFPRVEVNIFFRKLAQDLVEADFVEPMINSSLDKDYRARIRINKDYGFGMIYIVENIMTLINYFDNGGFDGDSTAFHLASANHVVIVTNRCSDRKYKQAENFLINAWQNHFVSHLLMILNQCGEFAFYDVLSKGHDTNKNGIIKWINVDSDEMNNVTSLFTYMNRNFRGYPMRFTVFDRYATMISEQNLTDLILPSYMTSMLQYSGHGGIDGIVLSYIVEKLNLSPILYKYSNANYGAYDEKTGKFDGTLGEIAYNRSDIAMNGRFIKDYGKGTFNALQFLTPILFDPICVITPKALEIPKWKKPLLIFNIYSWLGLFSIQLASSVMWFWLKKWEKRKQQLHHLGDYKNIHINMRLSELTIETALILFSAPSSVMRYLRKVERILMASFLFMSFYISGVFQASLTSSMSTTSFETDINTFEQLANSQLPIVTGSQSLSDLFGDADTPLMKTLKKKVKIMQSEQPNIWITANVRNSCSIERETDAEFIIRTKFMRGDGYPLLHVMKECPRSFYIGYMVRKGWPFAKDISRMIIRFKEAGLTKKWYNDVQDAIVRHINLHNELKSVGPEAFTLKHLIFSFYLLAIGLTFSTIVLLFEVFVKKGK